MQLLPQLHPECCMQLRLPLTSIASSGDRTLPIYPS